MPRLPRRKSDEALEKLRELQEEVQRLRSELAAERPAEPAEQPSELSDEDRAAVIEKAREELPALDKQVDESLEELRRLAAR